MIISSHQSHLKIQLPRSIDIAPQRVEKFSHSVTSDSLLTHGASVHGIL